MEKVVEKVFMGNRTFSLAKTVDEEESRPFYASEVKSF